MQKKVRKAVIPVAGFGTRFLPATKAQPKEMLPLVDKPIIQYVVEDAVSAGIEDIILVTGWHKRNIEDHFDYPFELEKRLEESGKHAQLEEIRKIANMANFYYVRQKGPLGNATPIWNARHIIGDEPFLVLWGDDVFEANPSRSQQLVDAYAQNGGSAILAGVNATKPDDYKRFGYAAGVKGDNGLLKINEIVEKPGKPLANDHTAVVSGLVLGPEFFPAMEEAMKRYSDNNTPGELVYIDAINILLEQNKDCYALEIENGRYYDCGNKLEYLKAVVEFGLKHEDMKDEFSDFLKKISK
ncbi:MAG TPA: UTP--glucose-1-phosphate uridylyltransferase [Patescibacteria group bacterium]|jgi:UTP--glucose-1-phosphate uridylyltransferase|nr:UTP--glucose-1-phosphate uridylyltransferase [Patescibacteria group bacterium]